MRSSPPGLGGFAPVSSACAVGSSHGTWATVEKESTRKTDGSADVDDRGYVCDRRLPILDLEEVRHGAVGPALARAEHGDRQVVLTLERQFDQPGHLDLTPRRGDEGSRSLDPDDGAVADEEVKRRPDHRPRDVELFFELAFGGKAGAGLPGPDLQHHLEGRCKLEVERYLTVAVKLTTTCQINSGGLLWADPQLVGLA